MALSEEDAAVGFIYKAMQQRDPSKRRVKPVAKDLMQLDFAGLDDSEDDSDFEIDKEKADSDNSNVDSNNEGSDSGSSNASSDSETNEDGNNSNGENAFFPDSSSKDLSLSELLENIKNNDSKMISEQKVTSTSSLKLICSVCLEDRSDSVNEVVECDSCGISVHEGCYGITDSDSVASSESSTSTEPWFCDACKAGVKPHCELCPYVGGIFKETDAGKWVHIVCALYTPGVTFEDTEKLSNCTLFELQYSRWGARECSLCDDGRYSWTGIVIGCDAGLCRNYFHVTCAQRDGLLAEAINDDEESVDPFFAHCKQHADKNNMKVKRRNWLALQNSMKYKTNENLIDISERNERKLNRHRQKYIAAHKRGVPDWAPQEKVPRLLSTCPEALKALIKKAELLGISDHGETQLNDVRKKWNIAPALSTEFVLYYFERNKRIDTMKENLKELLLNREKLKQENEASRKRYNDMMDEINILKEASSKLKELGFQMIKQLQKVSKKPVQFPEVFNITEKSTKQESTSHPALINKCAECKSSNDAHLLILCDSCKNYYHLGCLDPPLTRMPRQTKRYKWECSNCSPVSSDSEVTIDDTENGPRRLRRQTNKPSKFRLYISQKDKKSKAVESIINDEVESDAATRPVVLLHDITSKNQNKNTNATKYAHSPGKCTNGEIKSMSDLSPKKHLSPDQSHKKLVKTILRILDDSLKNKTQIVEMVVKSISASEKLSYSISIEHWFSFCEAKLAAYKPTSKLLLDFLKELKSRNISSNAIITSKSAVLLIARIMGIYKLDNDSTIKKFMESIISPSVNLDASSTNLSFVAADHYGRGKRRRTSSLNSDTTSPQHLKKSPSKKADSLDQAKNVCYACGSNRNLQKAICCYNCSNIFHDKCLSDADRKLLKNANKNSWMCSFCKQKVQNNFDESTDSQEVIENEGEDEFGIIDGTVDEDCGMDLFFDDADSEDTTILIDDDTNS